MTDTAEIVETKPKRTRKPKPPIDADAILAATHQPDYGVGDVVLYRPADNELRSLRSNRGLDVQDMAGVVTYRYPNGDVSLKLFRPLGFQDIPILQCAYSAEPKPNTFRMKP